MSRRGGSRRRCSDGILIPTASGSSNMVRPGSGESFELCVGAYSSRKDQIQLFPVPAFEASAKTCFVLAYRDRAPWFNQLDILTKKETVMTWVGSWRNQHGSVLEIISEANGRIEGSFRSAVGSNIKGQQVDVSGVHEGDLISFAVGERGIVVS